MIEKIIFDCDNTIGIPFKEVDDGLTLLYLLGVDDINILGITTTFGNGSIDQTYSQTHKIAQQMGLDFPVLLGEGYRGQDPDTPAAQFLVESVNQYPRQLTILATGPVGNLHAANQLDPDFYHKVKRILAMGGYLGAHAGQSTTSRGIKLGYRYLHELNFSANPEAAHEMLHAPCPVTVFPGQVCLQAPFTRKNIKEASWWPRKLRRILTHWLITFGLYCGVPKFYLWDLLPAVYLTNPNLFTTIAFPLASTIQDMQHGLLIENPNPQAHAIQVGTSIRNPSDFYNHLSAAWQQAAENYPPPQL
jgi:inosine-uridine nucleoside N-ribohydrolase